MKFDQTNFSRQLIKGRITEMIFEQMLRDAGIFTVLSFGYENILPELMHRQHDIKAEQTMEIIRRAPDFAIINNKTHNVYLVEVKYRRYLKKDDILDIAKRMYESWKPSFLFVATQEAFYFGKVADIVQSGGEIPLMRHQYISKELQTDYLNLMKVFIQNGDEKNTTREMED